MNILNVMSSICNFEFYPNLYFSRDISYETPPLQTAMHPRYILYSVPLPSRGVGRGGGVIMNSNRIANFKGVWFTRSYEVDWTKSVFVLLWALVRWNLSVDSVFLLINKHNFLCKSVQTTSSRQASKKFSGGYHAIGSTSSVCVLICNSTQLWSNETAEWTVISV